jgi:hypothetical protein
MRPDFFKLTEKLMAMDEAAWACHANPKSVYSRILILPMLSVAILSRAYIGAWSIGLIALIVLWIWWNPRAFGPPASTNNWASMGTFGERVFLNRDKIPVPPHHLLWGKLLTFFTMISVVPWIYGLWALDWMVVLLAGALVLGSKVWFVDRMVWLYQDMKDSDPTYASWMR